MHSEMMGFKTRIQSIPKEEVLRGAGLSLRNAERLMSDGKKIALISKSYPTANALFQFAIEEVGKALIMCEHYRHLHLGLDVDLKSLLSAFTNHHRKTRRSLELLKDVFMRAEGEYSAGRQIMEDLIDSSDRYETVRQESLYVSLGEEMFQAPIEVVDIAVMDHTLMIANASYNFTNEYHMTLVDPGYKFLSRTTERIRNSGGPVAPSVVLDKLKRPN